MDDSFFLVFSGLIWFVLHLLTIHFASKYFKSVKCACIITSTIHAFFCIVAGSHALRVVDFWDPNSAMWSSDPYLRFCVTITFSYLLSDTVVIIFWNILEVDFLIHHLSLTTFAFLHGLYFTFATPWHAVMLFNEFSTPFYNAHLLMTTYLNWKGGSLVLLNSLCLFVAFTFARIGLNALVYISILYVSSSTFSLVGSPRGRMSR